MPFYRIHVVICPSSTDSETFIRLLLIWDYTVSPNLSTQELRILIVNGWLSVVEASHGTWEQIWCHLSRLMTKPTKWPVRPAKNQISLGIRPVWSESSLSAWRNLGPLVVHWAHSEVSDLSFCWGHTHFVGFVMSWIILFSLLCNKCFQNPIHNIWE